MAGPWWWAAARPGLGSCSRPGRHARPALPVLRPLDGSGRDLWAAAHVLLGYLAGAGWRHIHQLTGRVGLALASAVLVALAVAWLLRLQVGIWLEGDGVLGCRCPAPRTPWATRPELTWVPVVHLAADTQLSAGGRRR